MVGLGLIMGLVAIPWLKQHGMLPMLPDMK
jgi:hypothetical protein